MARTGIENLDKWIEALKNMPKETRLIIREAVRDTVRIVAQRTRQAAPFDTGALREAITEAPPKTSSLYGYVKVQQGVFRGKQPSAYVLALEYGKGPGARPFIRTTSEREGPAFVARVNATKRDLEAIGGRNL
jgi:hypothetical protein